MSFAPQYIRGMTGQHLGLQWFAFLRWAGWQFEVTWQQEMFVTVLALKKLGTGQAMWHLLLGWWTDPFEGLFLKENAHPNVKKMQGSFCIGPVTGFPCCLVSLLPALPSTLVQALGATLLWQKAVVTGTGWQTRCEITVLRLVCFYSLSTPVKLISTLGSINCLHQCFLQ